jgi:hypothetical protein
MAVGGFKVMIRQPDLFQVIDALGAAGGFSSGLNSRKQQRDQNSDDSNHDKQLNQSEAAS